MFILILGFCLEGWLYHNCVLEIKEEEEEEEVIINVDCSINCSPCAWDLQQARLCSKGFYYLELRCASALQVGMRNC